LAAIAGHQVNLSVRLCLFFVELLHYNGETSLSPTIPNIIRNKQIILRMSLDSPNKIMPSIAIATAPMPVHTAYAVPIGMVFIATDNNQKLIAMAKTVNIDGTSLVNPSVYFNPTAHPHSKKPANIRKNQSIFVLPRRI
jgi:hypothetical protein